ncbi:chromosome segregation protein SMC [Erysipelatoclostridium sp. An173]|uniref:chromosome segregation protein SMC n=1 Tax=Erysipelatoclostridium sp. An173 TaxID=1965571 RepID=UPI000B36DD3B|nr:chromosome segregation protein SMC [Erysipelatoclostridium sp. An173]OUP79099.1 ATPase [Erysipelatoclostridium sp. An173]
MYLKRIEIHGFKSFADKVDIEFQPGITGIVGPNGCGKSNISDAVRWVLGEQSVKSLRGANMSDVIFAGSEDRRAQNLAEVTLVFDNSDRFMKYDYNEVEITRRLYRQNNEAEYLINKQQCRLKDIVDLIMDTGLGKDSLSIISQGNISSFADNKPEERRGIFEDAAGVSKYKKRKLESIRKLERTKENLERIGDIVAELEKQVGPLKRQKDKAEKYLELKEKLTAVEVNVLVKEITEAKKSLDVLSKEIKDLNEQQASLDADILMKENSNDDIKKKMYQLDQEVNSLQSKLLEAVSNVSKLETAKVEIDQKRKHALQSASKENLQENIANMKAILSDIVNEYNDRVERLNSTEQDLKQLTRDQENRNKRLTELKNELNQLSSQINKNRSRKEILLDAIENKSNYHQSIKTVLNLAKSNRNIIGVLGELITTQKGYELAISSALGGAIEFVVTSDDQTARETIKFLRNNKAGRATFLPVSTMKPRQIRLEHLEVCNTMAGFLGVASDFITYDDKIGNVVLNQLGNIIVAKDLETANAISKAVFARYRVVTLEGDIVNVGGSLTGGSINQQRSSLVQKRELEQLAITLEQQETEFVKKRKLHNALDNEIKDVSHILLQKQMAYAKLEVVVQSKKEELIKTKTEYESLTEQSIELDDFKSGKTENKLIDQLNEAIKYRDMLTEEIKSKREMRMAYANENEALDVELRTIRKDQKDIQNAINENTIKATKLETMLNNYLTRLNDEYHMTYEYAVEQYQEEINVEQAKEEVYDLRTQIKRLGNVNLDAIEEYKVISERYENMNTQRIDLLEAQDRILAAIKEMDEIMVTRFSETFEKINVEFNHVFRSLFGGGKAKIKYSDPTNILETGIDIDVQPPGKAVQNISLFSGGEKALIAISCLFAILRVKPIPMCILDEVEAALDIANVERFAKYLREFSSTTQFIVVTHREGTMEECDLLYGATMQQKGVTKLVSVKLEEAIDLSDPS